MKVWKNLANIVLKKKPTLKSSLRTVRTPGSRNASHRYNTDSRLLCQKQNKTKRSKMKISTNKRTTTASKFQFTGDSIFISICRGPSDKKQKSLKTRGVERHAPPNFVFKPTIKMVQSGTYLDIILGLKFQLFFLRCRLHVNFMIQGC